MFCRPLEQVRLELNVSLFPRLGRVENQGRLLVDFVRLSRGKPCLKRRPNPSAPSFADAWHAKLLAGWVPALSKVRFGFGERLGSFGLGLDAYPAICPTL